VAIDAENALATSYYHHRSASRFIATDEFLITRISISDPRMVNLDQKFCISPTGDMIAHETRTYQRVKDGVSAVVFTIGVDDESDASTGDDLGLTVEVGGRAAMADLFSLIVDESHRKWIRVTIGDGAPGTRFQVAIKYLWRGGFKRILNRNVDDGEFLIRGKGVEWQRRGMV
jgi:hypothetical protein